MIWWLKSRNVTTLSAATLLVTLVGIVFGRTAIPIPSVFGSAGSFLLGSLITVLPAVLWLTYTGRVELLTEATAVRPVRRWDTSLGAALAAASLVVTSAVHLLAFDDIALMVGRNVTCYLAIAMILAAFTGPRVAAPLTTTVPLVLAVAGWRSSGGGAQPWALTLHPGSYGPALAATVLLLGIAGAISLTVRPSRRLLCILNRAG